MPDNLMTDHLFEAIENVSLVDVKDLLARGADVNAFSKKGWTPLVTLTALTGRDHKVELMLSLMNALISHGADVNLQRPIEDGKSFSTDFPPLLWAINHGKIALVSALIDAGAKLDVMAFNLMVSALHFETFNIATLLILKGININTTSVNGDTPLMVLAGNGKAAATEFLLKAGAKCLIINKEGFTAFDICISNNKAYAASLIKEKIAKDAYESLNKISRTINSDSKNQSLVGSARVRL